MQFTCISFNQDIIEQSLKLISEKPTLLVYPTEKNKHIAQKLFQTTWNFRPHCILTMPELMTLAQKSEHPVLTDQKRHLFFAMSLSEDDKRYFRINGFLDSLSLSNEFFAFWEELSGEGIADIPAGFLEDWQQETWTRFRSIREHYNVAIAKAGYSDKLDRKIDVHESVLSRYTRVVFINEFYFSRREKDVIEALEKTAEIVLCYQAPENWVDKKNLTVKPGDLKGVTSVSTQEIIHYPVPDLLSQLMHGIAEINKDTAITTLIDTEFYDGPYKQWVNPERFVFQRYVSFTQTPMYQWLYRWSDLLSTRFNDTLSVKSVYAASCDPIFCSVYEWGSREKMLIERSIEKGLQFIPHHGLGSDAFSMDFSKIVAAVTWLQLKIFLDERSSRLLNDAYHGNVLESYYGTMVKINQVDEEGLLQGIPILDYVIQQLMLLPVSEPAVEMADRTIQVDSLMNTRNVAQDTVLLFNLSEGNIPTPRHPQFLLSESQRKLLGLKTYEDIVSRERYNFIQRVLSAKKAILFSIENQEKNMTTSSFVEEILLSFPDKVTVAGLQYGEDMYATYASWFKARVPRATLSPHKDDKLIRPAGSDKVKLSFTSYDLLKECAYRFGLKYGYKLNALDRTDIEKMKSTTLGNIIHDLFEQLGHEIEVRLPKVKTFDALSSELPYLNLIRKTFESHHAKIPVPYRGGYLNEILYPLLHESLKVFVEDVLGSRFAVADIQALLLEKGREEGALMIAENVAIEARADLRVESKSGEVLLIDFKTGKTMKSDQLDFYELYYYALNDKTPHYKMKAKLFYGVLDAYEHVMKPELSLQKEDLIDAVNTLNERSDYPRTDRKSHCQYCEYKAICRLQES